MYDTENVTSLFPSWYSMYRSDFKDVFTSKNKFCFISTWLIFGTVIFVKYTLSETHTLRRVLQDFLSPIFQFM